METTVDASVLMEQYFNKAKKIADSHTRKGNRGPSTEVVDLATTNTLGTAIIKLILPTTTPPTPIRTIYGYYDVTVPYQPIDKDTNKPKVDDAGNPVIYRRHVRFMEPNGYTCDLNDQQLALFDQVVSNLTKWDECKGYMEEEAPGSSKGQLWYMYKKSATIFYGYLVAFSSDSGGSISQGGVRLFRSYAKDFVDKFTDAVNNKSKRKGSSAWMNNYINRNSGTLSEAVTITTKRPNIAYETTVEFDECQPFNLDSAELESAGDITTEIIDQSFFDEDGLRDLNKELVRCINAYQSSHRNNFGTPPVNSSADDIGLPM